MVGVLAALPQTRAQAEAGDVELPGMADRPM
jgi:hypothetical protein